MNISKTLSLLEMKVWYPLLFKTSSLIFKVDKNRVLFADPYSTDLTDNMKPLYTALSKKDGVTLVKCFPNNAGLLGNSFSAKLKGRLNRTLAFNKFIKEYARCGVVFLTESYLPAYAVTPRDGTKVVQLWHGSGAFKKWGYSTLDKEFGASDNSIPMHNCYGLVPVSASEVIPHWAEAFNCSTSVFKPLGVPRTDELVGATSVSNEKLTILYAPTFRGNNITSAHCDQVLNIEDFKDYNLLIKQHPFAKNKIVIPEDCKSFCRDISSMDTNSALLMADILITDYSSIIFEYSLLNKPMIFYAYDLEAYKDNRDFYYPYEDFVPGPIVKSSEELLEAIKDYKAIDLEKIEEFKEKFMNACDGHSTERIIKELF